MDQAITPAAGTGVSTGRVAEAVMITLGAALVVASLLKVGWPPNPDNFAHLPGLAIASVWASITLLEFIGGAVLVFWRGHDLARRAKRCRAGEKVSHTAAAFWVRAGEKVSGRAKRCRTPRRHSG